MGADPQGDPQTADTSSASPGPATDYRDYLDQPAAGGAPLGRGRIRCSSEDFQVVEELGWEPSGDGDHLFLRLRKTDANTDWVAAKIAEAAGVHKRHISFAGLKDRFAVTEQSFTVLLPGREMRAPEILEAEPGIEILELSRNRRKIRRGGMQGNAFQIRIRNLSDPEGAPPDREAIDARLGRLAQSGVANYFGPQRFGRQGGNLGRALGLFTGRLQLKRGHKRGLYLSAARSYLFNRVLAARVRAGHWDQALEGEALALDGSRSHFRSEALDDEIRRRLAEMDIHPSGPLWGKGDTGLSAEALAFESEVLEPMALWREGLEALGLKMGRRALRLPVRDLDWDWEAPDQLRLAFRLGSGTYATTVLGELLEIQDARAWQGSETDRDGASERTTAASPG